MLSLTITQKPSIFERGDYVRLKKDPTNSPYVYTVTDTLRNVETGQWFVTLANELDKMYWNENGYNWILETEVTWEKIVTPKRVTQEPRESGRIQRAVDTEELGSRETLLEFLNEERRAKLHERT